MGRPGAAAPIIRIAGAALSQPQAAHVARIRRHPLIASAPSEPVPHTFVLPAADGQPLHLTYRISLLCADIVERMDVFAHIDLRRVLVTFARSRRQSLWGLQAKLVPLRFRNLASVDVRHGVRYRLQRLWVDDTEIYYVLAVYLPRFMNQVFDEKLVTIFHELFHIGPQCRGDVRRFPGTHHVHRGSCREFDRQMARWARAYLSQQPDAGLFDFLRLRYDALERRYGTIVGVQIPTPKMFRDDSA